MIQEILAMLVLVWGRCQQTEESRRPLVKPREEGVGGTLEEPWSVQVP